MAENVFNPEDGDAKFPPIVGVEFVHCQHLRDGNQGREDILQWAGDELRFVLCPICARVMSDTGMQRATMAYVAAKEYGINRSKQIDDEIKLIDAQIRGLKSSLPLWAHIRLWFKARK